MNIANGTTLREGGDMKTVLLVFLTFWWAVAAQAQDGKKYIGENEWQTTHKGTWNFPDRKAIVLDICPHVKITSFKFENTIEGRVSSSMNLFNYQWKNVSPSPVLAFEVVTLKYDPFDEPMIGSRTLVAGKNSADYSPLLPERRVRMEPVTMGTFAC